MEKMSQVGVYFYPNRSQADYSEPLQLQILGLCEALREIHDGDVEVGELGKTIDL